MIPYLSLFLTFLFALGLGLGMWLIATILNPRASTGGVFLGRRKAESPTKEDPFECGNPATPFRRKVPVKFYAVALAFTIFDVEAVFLYPWGVLYRELGWFGFVEMFIFLGVLALGLIYILRKGALRWT